MKKILLPLAALLLSATAVSAQHALDNSMLKKLPKKVALLPEAFSGVKANAPKRAEETVEKNQRYVGNTNSDNVATLFGFPGTDASKIGTILSSSLLSDYEGCKILAVRFPLYKKLGNVKAFVANIGSMQQDYTYNVGEYLVSKEGTANKVITVSNNQITSMPYNTIEFDTPYTIPANPSDLVVGMEYTQKSTQTGGSYTEDCYNFCGGEASSYGGLVAYGNIYSDQTEAGWVPVALSDGSGSSMFVNLCLQILVENPNGFVQDINIYASQGDKHFVQPNGTFQFAFGCTNSGSEELAAGKYTFGMSIDGKEIGEITGNKALGSDQQVFGTYVNVPEIEDGAHIFSLYVKSMNGGAPTGKLSNDTVYTILRSYSESVQHHKQLVEHFTSQWCTYCPKGYDLLNQLCKDRDDIAWVSIHGDLGDNYTDEYTIDASQYITAISTQGYPAANFNRYYHYAQDNYTTGYLALGINGYDNVEDAAADFSDIIDESNAYVPAVCSLGITANYNDGSLDVKVTGKGVKNAGKILDDAVLTLYLTEDGLKSRQLNNGKWINSYTHNNVLRAALTNYAWGDNIVWDGDNFTMEYKGIEIPDDYDYTKMHVVAAVSAPAFYWDAASKRLYLYTYDNTDLWVNQCNSVAISDGETTGIKSVDTNDNVKVVGRYTVDGRQVSAPVKGVNVVKFSDGTTKTVVVK